ncbi:SBBP repeat-containing protein [Paraflavisolibacter sp. H34]|uniref:SBBP repeat-containing protein n=1 Tax=Huijunlia imazamoxiresistens TaxID=3127457 RepID=UPI00301AA850
MNRKQPSLQLLLPALLFLLPFFSPAQPAREWVKRYNPIGTLSRDQAHALAVDASANVYVAGLIGNGESNSDFALVKRDKSGNHLWTRLYNGPNNFFDAAKAVAVDAAGNVYVTGESTGNPTIFDYATVKYSASGVLLWTARYSGPGTGQHRATALAVDAAGNVYVTGQSRGTASEDYATVKYNAAGVQQWAARYNGPANSSDFARALAVDGSGNVYVTGHSFSTAGRFDYLTVKYNAAGAQQWEARYDGPGHDLDEAHALAVDGSGNVYVAGQSAGSSSFPDYATVKYSAAGVQQWAARYDGPVAGSFDAANALVLEAAGNVYVTGQSDGGGSFSDYVTLKYNNSGVQQWLARYNGTGNASDFANALAVDASGNVYVTGESRGTTSANDFATVKYNASGVQQWAARLDGTAHRTDGGYALRLDASGNVYVAGRSEGTGTDMDMLAAKYSNSGSQQWIKREAGTNVGTDHARAVAADGAGGAALTGWSSFRRDEDSDPIPEFLTVKYNADGSRKWEKRYNDQGNASGEAAALAVDPSGNVLVTGFGFVVPSNRRDYVTIKYSTDGSQKWVKTYNGPGSVDDRPAALATDKDGNVYVTGESFGSGDYDFATIKYDKDGNRKWVVRYNGPASSSDMARALAVDGAGNVYVTGRSRSASLTEDFATVKYDKNGVQLWAARYPNPAAGFGEAKAIAVDASGNVYVSGTAQTNYITLKYNAAGLQQWAAVYNGPANNHDFVAALALDGWGNVLVAGYSHNGSNYDYATVRYDNSGVQQWAARYNGPDNGDDFATSLAVNAAGHAVVTGRSHAGAGATDFATVAYDAQGAELGADRFNGTANSSDDAEAVAVDKDGKVFVAGGSFGTGSGEDYLIIKYSPAVAATTSTPATAANERMTVLPGSLRIAHAPNPVASTARIRYELPFDGQVSLKLYDLQGRETATIVEAAATAGVHHLLFDASRLPKGIYHYRLTLKSGNKAWTRIQKMSVVR